MDSEVRSRVVGGDREQGRSRGRTDRRGGYKPTEHLVLIRAESALDVDLFDHGSVGEEYVG